jgi:hypothetical protein
MNFGSWGASGPGSGVPGPLDRFGPVPPTRNVHLLLPHEVDIDEGGSVSFVISGAHLVLIYDDGHEPGDINTTLLIPGIPSFPPPLIDDPNRRIYRGLDPRPIAYVAPEGTTTPVRVQDRVESVQFPVPGRYLVVCGVLPHFLDEMIGYVNVKRRGRD